MLIERLGSHADIHIQKELLTTSNHHKLSRKQKLWYSFASRLGVSLAKANFQYDGSNFLPVVDTMVWGNAYRHFKAAGFKILVGQWLALPAEQKQAFLKKYDMKVIWLLREDILSHFISTAQAEQSGYKHRLKDQPPLDLAPVHVTIEDLKAFHKNLVLQTAALRPFFSEANSIEVRYEELVRNPYHENNRILEFLGVPALPLTDVLAKNSVSDLSSRIADFESFSRSLRGTTYERFLPDNMIKRD